MIKGLYLAKAGMFGRTKKLDVIANNLANINTSGFKKDKLFYNRLVDAQNAIQNSGNSAGLRNAEMVTDYTAGELQQTGNPLDVAIVGDGFFEIQTPSGTAYTRNGNFSLDSQNRLITRDGSPVLGNGGEIQVAGNQVKISQDGSILVDGQSVDKIKIVSFEKPDMLTKMGSNLFADEGEAGLSEVEPDKVRIRQGFLEGSNVNGIEEMIQMIELYRKIELGQKTLKAQDETLEKLINDAGRVG